MFLALNKAYFVFFKNTDMDITFTEKSQIYNKGNIQLYYYEIDLINFTSQIQINSKFSNITCTTYYDMGD